jgi:hypothetical protein
MIGAMGPRVIGVHVNEHARANSHHPMSDCRAPEVTPPAGTGSGICTSAHAAPCPDLSLRYFPNQARRPVQEPLLRRRVIFRVRNLRWGNCCCARRLPWIPPPFSSSLLSWSFLVAAITAEDATTEFQPPNAPPEESDAASSRKDRWDNHYRGDHYRRGGLRSSRRIGFDRPADAVCNRRGRAYERLKSFATSQASCRCRRVSGSGYSLQRFR